MSYTREIGGKIYSFKFGIGFVREIDKTKVVKTDSGDQQKMGLTYAIAGLIDRDFEKLIDCLMYGNKFGDGEKLDRKQIEDWLDSGEASVEDECRDLLDFFESANFTAKKTRDLLGVMERNQALQEAQYQAELEKAKAATE